MSCDHVQHGGRKGEIKDGQGRYQKGRQDLEEVEHTQQWEITSKQEKEKTNISCQTC